MVSSHCVTHFSWSVKVLQVLATALQVCCPKPINKAINGSAAHLLLCFDGIRIVGMLP